MERIFFWKYFFVETVPDNDLIWRSCFFRSFFLDASVEFCFLANNPLRRISKWGRIEQNWGNEIKIQYHHMIKIEVMKSLWRAIMMASLPHENESLILKNSNHRQSSARIIVNCHCTVTAFLSYQFYDWWIKNHYQRILRMIWKLSGWISFQYLNLFFDCLVYQSFDCRNIITIRYFILNEFKTL